MAERIWVPQDNWTSIPQNIKFLATNPCGATPWIYLETLLPVLGEAAIDILSFGLSDVLIGYAHPKPRRGWRRHDRGREKRRLEGRDGVRRPIRDRGLPEIGNEIGRHLPGSKWVKSQMNDGIGHLFWGGIDIVERAAWYWLLADVAKDGIYHWASDIYKESCPDPGLIGWAQGSGPGIAWPNRPVEDWDQSESGMSFAFTGGANWICRAPELCDMFCQTYLCGESLGQLPGKYSWTMSCVAGNSQTGEWKPVQFASGGWTVKTIWEKHSYSFVNGGGASNVDTMMGTFGSIGMQPVDKEGGIYMTATAHSRGTRY